MRTKEIRRCVICGKKFIVFTGNGGKPFKTEEYHIRNKISLTCSHDCAKVYSKFNTIQRKLIKLENQDVSI